LISLQIHVSSSSGLPLFTRERRENKHVPYVVGVMFPSSVFAFVRPSVRSLVRESRSVVH
jgi:hypothetical protein